MINIADHYWIIAGSTTDVYGSKTNTRVAANDPVYVGWSASNAASSILNEAELADVLKPYNLLPAWLFGAPTFIQPTPTSYDKDQLKAYSAYARATKQRAGILVNGIPFPTDAVTLGGLNSAYIYTIDKAADTFSWKLPDGTFITLDTQGIKDLQSAVSEFGQRCFDCEDQLAASIDAGTVSALPPIDAAYAAISNEFTSPVVQRRK